MLSVLLADDEPTIRLTVGDALRDAGYQVTVASDGAEAMAHVEARRFDAVVTDIRMPKVDGITLFRRLRAQSPDTDVILITAHGEVNDAVSALKDGAYDYLTKPFDPEEITLRLRRLAERKSLQRDLDAARQALANRDPGVTIIGQSPQMVRLLKRLDTIANSDAAVVITGESGTGKELVARALHMAGTRRTKPFVAVNCAAFPETLIEAELFGHEAGAFTGASRRRDGRFKAADGGTLFLDEIAEIPLMVQAKLLRVVQEGAVEPLGSNTAVKADVRLLCATHRNLKSLIRDGRFREDLYYRLNVLDIHVPALRERRGDMPLLVEFFLRRYMPDAKRSPTIAPRAWAALCEYPFPGNVRELEHAIQHAVVLARGAEIDLEHLPADIAGIEEPAESREARGFQPLAKSIKEFEREYLLRALTLTNGKRTRTAKLLGISRKNLWEKLRGHGISDTEIQGHRV